MPPTRTTRRLLRGAATLILAAASTPCTAQERALISDRPDFTESSRAVSPGVVQVEAGYTLARTAGVNGHSLGEVLLRIGVLQGAEVRVGLNSFAWSDGPGDPRGLEDASLGLKVELAPGAPEGFHLFRPRVALLVYTSLPTGAEALGEDALQPGATLAVSWDLSDRLGMGANAGIAAPAAEGDRFGRFSGSLSLGVSVTPGVGAYGEYYVLAPPRPDADAAGVLNGGFTVLVTGDFQLDLRAGWGVHGDDTDAFLGAGLATRF